MADSKDIKKDGEFGDEIEAAENVVDKKSYNDYLRYKKILTDKTQTHMDTSDPNIIVNLMAGTYFIDKKISHLPDKEQEDIREKAKAIRNIKGLYTQAKKRAFGVVNRPDSFTLTAKRDEVIELFGRFYSVAEVHQVVTTEWGIDVNPITVNNFRKHYIDQIRERQEEYKREFSDLRLGYKRSRLDELTYLYNTRKVKYRATQGKEDYKLLLATLEQIKREVEGDRIVIDGNITMDIESTVSEHIQKEIIQQLNIIDIIIARVAARTGTDARFLIAKLRASHYAKFTGFLKPDVNIMQDEIIYPSKLLYNFDEIERKHKLGLIQEAEIVQEDPKIEEKGNVFKDMVLQKIAQKKNHVELATKALDAKMRKEEPLSKEVQKVTDKKPEKKTSPSYKKKHK